MKSSLAVALALATGQAAALGLGPIQVRSGLNQPLLAEIPVTTDSPAEANDLKVDLASAEDFQRVGLNRTRVGIPIDFAVGSNGRGQTVIKLTTKDAVREPFLDFLIEVNWGKGKLLREYTVLLDPPVTAPAVVATTKPAAAPAPAPAPVVKPKPVEARPAVVPSEPVAAKPAPAPAPAPALKPAPAPPAAKPVAAPPAAAGQYGPVERGQTLSAIAREVDNGTDLNQLMLALLKANPNAFYRDNINALKAGTVLRVPSADEVRAANSLKDATALVREQNQAWRDSAGQPALVTHTGAPAVSEAAAPGKPATAAKSEHLALVPPQAGKGGESGSDHAGSGKDGGDASHSELARTKETLANRDQEASELKSRVKQLEEINDKGNHLISLKDSEIADLQNKLKELQAAKAAAAAAATTAATTAVAAKPAEAAAVPPPEVKPAAETVANAAKSEAPSAAAAAAPPPATPASTTPASTTPATAEVTPPPPAVSAPAPASASTAAEIKPLPTTPAKPPVPLPAAKPAPASSPGDNPYLLYGLGAILLLLGGWAWTRFMRKPKPMVRPQFATAGYTAAAAAAEPEDDLAEHAFESEPESFGRITPVAIDPTTSLELLRHYHAQGDALRFEELAESLHAHLAEDSPEWQEVSAMGASLSPQHPLFAEAGERQFTYEPMPDAAGAHEDMQTQRMELPNFRADEAHTDGVHAFEASPPLHEDEAPVVHESTAHEAAEFAHETAEDGMPTPVRETGLNEFLTEEDTIGTRLDLARAYLDMGDPDGARSMLDEVLAEGNAAQKEEARKLLAELH